METPARQRPAPLTLRQYPSQLRLPLVPSEPVAVNFLCEVRVEMHDGLPGGSWTPSIVAAGHPATPQRFPIPAIPKLDRAARAPMPRSGEARSKVLA